MQQLNIKLSPELTEKYLAIAAEKTKAEMENDMEASGVYLDICIGLAPGIQMLEDLKVDGQPVPFADDDLSAVEVTLEENNEND